MKNKKFVFIVSFFFALLLNFGQAKTAFGCGDPPRCYPQDTNNCSDPECNDCSWCKTPTSRPPLPTDDRESIEGKIKNPVLPENLSTLQGKAFLSKLLRTGISLMFVFGSIIFLFILTSGGVKWLSSSGDKVKLESAQKQITSGLTGLAILLTTFVIIQLVQTIFGIDLLNITLPTL